MPENSSQSKQANEFFYQRGELKQATGRNSRLENEAPKDWVNSSQATRICQVPSRTEINVSLYQTDEGITAIVQTPADSQAIHFDDIAQAGTFVNTISPLLGYIGGQKVETQPGMGQPGQKVR